MRHWGDSTFVFISTNQHHHPGGVEERWVAVMAELVRLGSTVHYLCLMHTPTEEAAREAGVTVAPYILDKWNPIRSRSRLRKYLRRYVPVCAHSCGLEADLFLRWAARRVPEVAIAHTLASGGHQPTRRRPSVEALMRRYDELGMKSVAAVFAEDEELRREVVSAGVAEECVHLDEPAPAPAELRVAVERHMALYRELMADRGHDA